MGYIECFIVNGGWSRMCCLPEGNWFILSVTVKVVTKKLLYLHSDKWVSGPKRNMSCSHHCAEGLGASEEGYWSGSGSTRSFHSRRISLLSLPLHLLSPRSKGWQSWHSLRCAVAYTLEQTCLGELRTTEFEAVWPGITHQAEADLFFF